ncbi:MULTISPECIES: hypothetical protein [unclassified Pseudomonas]|uniref:hypothetical protein n=1 Tax=unclassified Pseudomonas TaxID=196821 RepID=UPI002448FB1E|nr:MULTISPECIES: hypothetical protein [unclassified Pseudomonas]MDH0894382.1 hypothetical protein [Pseudomonas sp. GD03875]MDH1063323.1 hypothetical protein [Pseudomonas sp. GD03985]
MDEQERLDRQAGSLAALEGAFAVLVEHLAMAGVVKTTALIADLRRLSELPGKDADIQRAEHRLLRMLEKM